MARHKTVETDAAPGNPEGHIAAHAAQKPQKERKQRSSMIGQGWGPVFHQAATEGRDRSWVIEEMKARYPDKVETILKWVDWYKNFYNMGRIKGFDQGPKVVWTTDRSAEREAAKAEKAEQRALAKAEKIAAREQAKADKKAVREAERAAKKAAASQA